MPRQQPSRPKPQVGLQGQEAPAKLPSVNDPTYRVLCSEESEAYTAWLLYSATNEVESKSRLNQLRRLYEQRRDERKAYQPPESAS